MNTNSLRDIYKVLTEVTGEEIAKNSKPSIEKYTKEMEKIFPPKDGWVSGAKVSTTMGPSINIGNYRKPSNGYEDNSPSFMTFSINLTGKFGRNVEMDKIEIEQRQQAHQLKHLGVKFRKIKGKTLDEVFSKLIEWFKKNEKAIKEVEGLKESVTSKPFTILLNESILLEKRLRENEDPFKLSKEEKAKAKELYQEMSTSTKDEVDETLDKLLDEENPKTAFETWKKNASYATALVVRWQLADELNDYGEDEGKLEEAAPPDEDIENWIVKNKERFRKEYGDDYASVLYGKAWNLYKGRKG